jgi:hypothetical protein
MRGICTLGQAISDPASFQLEWDRYIQAFTSTLPETRNSGCEFVLWRKYGFITHFLPCLPGEGGMDQR